MNKLKWLKIFNFVKWIPLGFSAGIGAQVILANIAALFDSAVIVPLALFFALVILFAAVVYLIEEREGSSESIVSKYCCLVGLVVSILWLLKIQFS